MGEVQGGGFQVSFNRAVQVRATDERLTSDAGVLLVREADHRLGLVESLAAAMVDPRDPSKVRYTLIELLRQRLYAMALGYDAQDDLDRLAHDPALKLAVWDRPGADGLDERLASQPTHSRLVDLIARRKQNLEATRDALGEWVLRHVRATDEDRRVTQATIDLDSFPLDIHGQQPGGAYNGHYQRHVYHPLVASFVVGGDYDGPREGLRLGVETTKKKRVRACDLAERQRRVGPRRGAVRAERDREGAAADPHAHVSHGRGFHARRRDGRVAKHARRLIVYVAQAVAPLWAALRTCLARWRVPARWQPHGPCRRAWTPPPRHAFLRPVLRI